MDDGIIYHPNGEITIGFDKKTWKLGRPKLKTYRLFSERLQDMRQAIQDVNEQIGLLTAALEEDDADVDAIDQQIKELDAPIWEFSIPILADIVETVAGKPLPDPEDWPAWLATGVAIPTDVLRHWREVPKSPGEAGRN
jgi:hypothetical protein